MTVPATFCPLLFQQFDSSRGGSPCCFYSGSKSVNFKDMLNNPSLKKAQEDAVNGIKNKTCDICWKYEEVGIKSLRQYAIDSLGYSTDAVLKQFVLDTGNVCNLSCRTCNPFASSGWIKEAAAFDKKTFPVRTVDYDSMINDHDFSQLTNISVMGGEPLKDINHLKVLRKIVENGNSKNCNLNITTNATNVPTKEMIEVWSQFKNTNLDISVDAIGKQFRYIRTDGEWEKVLEFMDYVRSSIPNLRIRTNVVFSALNIFYLDELYEWIVENDIVKKSKDSGNSGILALYPEHYNFTIFTDDQRQQLIQILAQSRFQNYYQGIIRHIGNVQFNQRNLNNFWIRTEFTKKFKKYDAEEYLPRLLDFLKA